MVPKKYFKKAIRLSDCALLWPLEGASKPGAEVVNDTIPGLTAWLNALRLESYVEAAACWAEEQGAISLGELVENMDDLAVHLELKPVERKRLAREGLEAAASALATTITPSAVPTTYASTAEEKRIDTDDGQARTLRELHVFYSGQYSEQEIDEYWEDCKPMGNAGTHGHGHGHAERNSGYSSSSAPDFGSDSGVASAGARSDAADRAAVSKGHSSGAKLAPRTTSVPKAAHLTESHWGAGSSKMRF